MAKSDETIIRKGAISARRGQRVIIPLNMRDGCILGVGKGNKKWNYSAPHGAERISSRKKAREMFKVKDFKLAMRDVYSSCVDTERLDECPMAYKEKATILANIVDMVDVQTHIKSIYNFKS